jgi:hypothetical protein
MQAARMNNTKKEKSILRMMITPVGTDRQAE